MQENIYDFHSTGGIYSRCPATGAKRREKAVIVVGLSHLIVYPTTCYNKLVENKIIKNDKFRQIASNIKPDTKKRIVLSRVPVAEGVTYHIYCNEIGQIILDPHISIPASEVWLYKNPSAHEAVEVGLKEAGEGKITKINPDDL